MQILVFQLIEEIACETLFNVSLYHPRVQSTIKPLKLEFNQPESNHLQPENPIHETGHYFHHNKRQGQIGKHNSYNQFYEMNRLFQNPTEWPGQTLHEHTSHLRKSTYAFRHLPTHSGDDDTLRLVTPGSTSSTSSFESRDESSERPSVIVKNNIE